MIIDKSKVDLIRARKCVSIADLVEAGIPAGTLNAMWNHSNVRPETAGRLANALGVDVEEIIVTDNEQTIVS